MALDRAFEADSLLIGDLTGILTGSGDPAVDLLDAPPGSIYLRTNGQIWQKLGVLPNDWGRMQAGVTPDYVIANDELVFVDDELVEV
jgi:hypothetical protein